MNIGSPLAHTPPILPDTVAFLPTAMYAADIRPNKL